MQHSRSEKPDPRKKYVTKKQVKNLIARSQEPKYFDQNQTASSVSTAGNVYGALVIPTQGIGESQRVGDTLHIKELDIRLCLTAADSTQFLRVVIFQWQENNSVNPPTIAKVFEQVATNPWAASLKMDYIESGTLKVIHDKLYSQCLNSDSAVISRRIKLTGKKLHKKKLEFDVTAVTGWDNYYIAAISDSVAVTHPTLAYCARATYMDS